MFFTHGRSTVAIEISRWESLFGMLSKLGHRRTMYQQTMGNHNFQSYEVWSDLNKHTHTQTCIYLYTHLYIYIYNIHTRKKKSYNCSVSRLAPGTPYIFYIRIAMNSQCFFFDGDLFYSMWFPCVLVKNSPLLLNYTYTVVVVKGSLSCSTQPPPLRQRPSLRHRIRWSSWRHVISSRTLGTGPCKAATGRSRVTL